MIFNIDDFSQQQLLEGVSVFHEGEVYKIQKTNNSRFKTQTEAYSQICKINEGVYHRFNLGSFVTTKIVNCQLRQYTVDIYYILYSVWYRHFFESNKVYIITDDIDGLQENLNIFNSTIDISRFHLKIIDDEGEGNLWVMGINDFFLNNRKFKKTDFLFFYLIDSFYDYYRFIGKQKRLITHINRQVKDQHVLFIYNHPCWPIRDLKFDCSPLQVESNDHEIQNTITTILNTAVSKVLNSFSDIISLIDSTKKVYLCLYTSKLGKLITLLKGKGINVVEWEDRHKILDMDSYVYIQCWEKSINAMEGLVCRDTFTIPFDVYIYKLPPQNQMPSSYFDRCLYPNGYLNEGWEMYVDDDSLDFCKSWKDRRVFHKISESEIEFPYKSVCIKYVQQKYPHLDLKQINMDYYEATLDDVNCLVKDPIVPTRQEMNELKNCIKQWLVEHKGYMDEQVKTIQICTTNQVSLRLKKLNSVVNKISDINYRCDATAELMVDGTIGIITWCEPWNKKVELILPQNKGYYWQTTRGTWKIHIPSHSLSSSCTNSICGD